MNSDDTNGTKLPYASPKLQEFGTMQELTATFHNNNLLNHHSPYGGGIGIS